MQNKKSGFSSSLLAVFLVGFLGIVPMEIFKLYDKFPHIDKVFHFAGGLVIAWMLSYIFLPESKNFPSWKFIIMLTGAATLIGVVWEFAEYLSGYYFSTATGFWHTVYLYFHGGDLPDTLGDLLFDILGAGFFAIVNSFQRN